MKRTFKYALTAIVTAAFVMPVFASTDNFPDVPDNHWAFEALQRLKKDGILVGYPDGLFRGNRPASRYELAVAVHAAYVNLKSVTDGLDAQIKALSDKLNGLATTADLQNLRDALTALQNEVNSMKGYGEDIAELKKLADTFQKELQSLGVDVEALKKDLGDLAARVSALEKKKPAVSISGDVDFLMFGGNSRNGNPGLNMDGYQNGLYTNPKTGATGQVGLTQDLQTMEEGAFTFSGNNETGPKWKATIVVGNMLDTFTSQSPVPAPGGPGNGHSYAEGNSDVYIQDLSVKFDSSIVGWNFNTELGRVGYKVDPYMFQRPAESEYFSNARWDDGLWRFDGGIIGFHLGGAKLNVFGGNNDNVTSSNGFQINPMLTGPLNGGFAGLGSMPIERTLGINLDTPLGPNGNLNLAYLWLDSLQGLAFTNGGGTAEQADRLAVYGGDLSFAFGRLKVSGGYSKSDLMYNSSNINNSDDSEWNAKLEYGGHKWGLSAGYREVNANYMAPGDWGRLGVQLNPTNIEGWQVAGHLNITHALILKATGEFDKGVSDNYGMTGFNTGTDINTYTVGLTYLFNPNLGLRLGWEDDEFTGLDPSVEGNSAGADTSASYKWATIGVDYGFSENTKWSIQYQISDVSNDYQVTPGGPGGIATGRFTGGFLTTQFSIKF